MDSTAKQFLNGEGSSTPQISTTVQEELGQNNSGEGLIVHDQGVVSEAAAAKALGKRKLVDFVDEQLEGSPDFAKAKKCNNMASPRQSADLGKASTSSSSVNLGDGQNLVNEMTAEQFKEAVAELVRLATEELRVMAVVTEPLWRLCGADDGRRILDNVAYGRLFPSLVGRMQLGFESEASRGTARIKLSPEQLVNMLMDVSKWSAMFYEIVSTGTKVDVLMNPGGAADYDGTLQLMNVRYQLAAPLVPIRQSYFARYCKKYSENDWLVVDVSLDGVQQVPGIWCKKRPSGCLIQGLSDGFSQITWLEHVEADYMGVSPMYQYMLFSGIGFGAKRWLSTLERRSQQMGAGISLRAPLSDYTQLVISSDEQARRMLTKIAARMGFNLHSGISGMMGNWKMLSGDATDNIRIMHRENTRDPSLPGGHMVSAAWSIWLPVPPKTVFDFLSDHNSRSEPLIPYQNRLWEVLTDENAVEPVCHISKGQEASYCVSIHKVLTENSSQENILLLQESCSDPVASYIAYSRLGTEDMNLTLSGRSSEFRPLLPAGFVVHPDGTSGGSLLTMSFQLSVEASMEQAEVDFIVRDLISGTTGRVRVALEGYLSQMALLASLDWAS